jgi:hypothetical protein
MSTSGTTAFNLDFAEIAEEAWERAGREMRSGYDLRTARRSMNLLMLEWQNRGLNLFTYDEGQVVLVQGVSEYALPADTIDLLEAVIRTNPGNPTLQSDLSISRISMPTYATIPNKLNQGRPIQMWVDRQVDQPNIYLWPVPDRGTVLEPFYVLRYWRMRRIQDAGTGVNTADINARFLPALVAGLAFHIAMKVPELMPRVEMLKMSYEETYRMATDEDREKAPVRIVPRIHR